MTSWVLAAFAVLSLSTASAASAAASAPPRGEQASVAARPAGAQAAVLERVDQLMARLEQAVTERRLSQARANRWRSALHTVRRDVQQDARRQGFLGLADLATYDRTLAGVERDLGGHDAPEVLVNR
ncbi:hypothetical protein [Deinococcus petrolearius]|uniref:Uncharacterized protein n=1 Tax=Deinococcus petrolearius TaxID=1751295 RepID=A0ABW1DJN9_9DEIO